MGIEEEEMGWEIYSNLYLTDKGEDVIHSLKEKFNSFKLEEIVFEKTDFEKKFEELWELFPVTDKFLNYPKTRILRTDRDKCKKYYRKILEEYKHEDVINALNYEIDLRSNNISNKDYSDFKYMKSSVTWLHSKEFINVLESMKNDDKETPISKFSKDV